MFGNIGEKIKSISVVFFGLEVIISIIAALLLFFAGVGIGEEDYTFLAIVCGIAGPIVAYISSCFLYGFGELIEKVQIIAGSSKNAPKIDRADELPPLYRSETTTTNKEFTRLMLSPKNLYTEGSPILIIAGALLKSNNTGHIFAQLKIRNLSNKSISAIKVRLNTLDAFDRPLNENVEYQYLDLDIKPHSFGLDQKGIPIENANVRSFTVSILEVMFNDHSLWKDDAVFEPAPDQRKITEALSEPISKQYARDINATVKYEPIEYKDIWFCVCGHVNKTDDDKCCLCHNSKDKVLSAYDPDLIAKHLAEYEKQITEKEIERNNKKAKSLFKH